jgi:hypothetical protein
VSEASRLSLDGIACATMQEFWDTDRAGAFIVVDVPTSAEEGAPTSPYIWLKVPAPGGGYEHARLPLRPSPANDIGASWEWDGNRERPTLSPSVWCRGIWHGFLRAGRFESC